MTDEEGNEFYYREELIIPVGDKKFALLVGINEDEEHDCGCDCGCDDEDVFIARIDLDENGEEVYVDPTDEEFEELKQFVKDVHWDRMGFILHILLEEDTPAFDMDGAIDEEIKNQRLDELMQLQQEVSFCESTENDWETLEFG